MKSMPSYFDFKRTYFTNEERSLRNEINGRKKISQFASKLDMLRRIRLSYSSAIANVA